MDFVFASILVSGTFHRLRSEFWIVEKETENVRCKAHDSPHHQSYIVTIDFHRLTNIHGTVRTYTPFMCGHTKRIITLQCQWVENGSLLGRVFVFSSIDEWFYLMNLCGMQTFSRVHNLTKRLKRHEFQNQ